MADDINQAYRHRHGAVYLLRLHWMPRRRRKVLVGPVAERLDTVRREKAAALERGGLRLAMQPDHFHLCVGVDPKIASAQIAYRLKGDTARSLRQEFPQLRKMLSMWTSSYVVSSAGHVSAATMDAYRPSDGMEHHAGLSVT